MADFSLSKIITLLDKANEQHVNISFAEDVLSVQVQKGKQIDKSLLEELRDNKPFLIYYFKNFGNATNGSGIPAIPKADRDEYTNIPASFAQERLWFIHQLEGSVQYHLPTIIRLKGNLNVAAIRYTLQNIINRHEALRTVIIEQEGKACQKVLPKDQWQLNTVEGSLYKNSPEELQHFIQQLVSQPFDLSADTMLRAHLIRMEADEHILVVTMHHLASDAWSEPILLNEVLELYSAFTQGRNPQLPDVEIQYADYAIWQRNYLQGEVLDKKIAYWKEKLEGAETLQLPVDMARPVSVSSKGGQLSFSVDKQTADQLAGLCREQGVTLFMLLLSVYKILLYRYSGQYDITVGTSIASRQQRELEGLIGYFVNILALRDEIHPDASFIELLQQVKATTLGAYQHQDVPFEKVVEAVVSERNTGRNPLFQVMLVLANTPKTSGINISGLELSYEATEQTTAKFDITFFINETPDGLEGSVQYSTDLFSAVFIRRMTVHFSNLLKAVASNPQQKAGSLSMLNREEETQLLNEFNNASVAYPADKSTVDLFEEQAAKMPGQIALVFENESLTYGELNERSNQLAHFLKSKGAAPGKLIPLYVERSAAMMIGMLGILKAGAAYVPVDTDFPQERISYMLQNTNATIVVSNSSVSAALEDADVVIVETDDTIVSYQPKTNLAVKPSPKDLLYVIYTSGSTGRPKGVMVTHQNLFDYYFGLDKYTGIANCKSFALVSTIATDLGNTVIFASLLSGGALHVFSKTSVSSAAYLQRYFEQQQIDCVKIVPSHWKALSTDDELLLPKKLIIFGGEALPSEAVQAIQSSDSNCAIVNHYGPTETTIGKLLHPVQPEAEYGSTIPIGKPFSNTRVYVLTKELQLCPQGIPGQLFIAGHGVAKGYYNNEPLTAEKFIDNPFILNEEKTEWGKMYATGDKVKWLADGNILFMGRADDQVKIRGYRVEPGEVESILQQCSLVKAAAVLAIEDKQGNKKLVAYIVARDEFDREEILTYLKEKLPEYMVPAVLVPMDALPLTANGKINRKVLPHPDETETATGQYVAPRNEAEKTMATLWADILELEESEVGIHNDFFEIGGHSLLAVRLVSGIRKAFGVEVPIGDVFDYPTVAAFTTRLNNQSEKTLLPSITKQPKSENIPLSFSQERLWFIDQLDGSVQYHIPAVLRLKGRLDKQALANALQQIINRHEVLRTVIIEKDGQPFQSVKEPDSWELQMVDGHSYKENKEGLQNYIQQLSNRPFHLSEDYMLRASLINFHEDENVLVVTLHHISSDAWSNSVMVNELMEFYHAGVEKRETSLLPLPIQYADFAIWQRNYLQGSLLDKKLNYWKEKLQGVSPLQLPTDMQRPAVQSTNGAVRVIKIKKELADSLQHLSQQQGTTLFMTLLASLNVLLYRYSGQEDICVGTPVAGRQQAELETLIGFFVNTLALRCAVDGNTSFKDLLQQVKATTLGAYEHQDVPFEKVVETVVEQRDVSRSPLFQVMLILQNTPKVNLLQLENLELQPVNEEDYPRTTSKFDLTFTVTETTDGLTLSVEYCTDLYIAPTIDKMMAHYATLLSSVVQRPEQNISLLPMLSIQEEQQLLNDFNNTADPYATDKTIIDLFEEQAHRNPSATAIIHEKETITYQQLNERSNQLAHYLAGKGVTAETLVPVCIERSINMLVAILGILKAGAAYVPIDPQYPEERIGYMLEDTAAGFVLTTNAASEKLLEQRELQIIQVDENEAQINTQPLHNPATKISGNQLAYIIYTSGSTGKPKGVMITHGNVYSFIHWCRREFADSRFDIAYFGTSICFDLSIFEIFYPFSIGKPIRLLEDGLQIAKYISEEQFVMANCVPGVIRNLLTDGVDFSHFSIINMAGEPIPAQVHQGLDTDTIEVRNLYGPTESTTYSTFTKLSNKLTVTIGKPVSNTVIYILSPAQQLVPAGVAGEIYISGAGLARGYYNRPELTAERFVDNPFNAGAKMYRTGDVGRWLPDGNIEFLGRADTQVKVRGYRIELAEVETILQQSNQVLQAVVEAKKDVQGNTRLVAYIVPQGPFNKEGITAYLKSKLPGYMAPSLWVEMAAMPLTPNGKINRKALPDPDLNALASSNYIAPQTDTEISLATIWQELLGIERISVTDDFFSLGGHSLLAVRIVSAIRKQLGTELSIKALFYQPTIAALAALLDKQHKGLVLPPIEPAPASAQLPLSFSQERLWFLDQLGGSVQYHIPIILRLQGVLNKEALFQALQQIVQRHEALHTVIREKEGVGYQYIKDASGWLPEQVNGSAYAEDTSALQQYIQQLIGRPFALSEDNMLRVTLVELSEQDNILVAVMHHIASDGLSVSILINELSALYTAYVQGQPARLAPLPVRYADYAIWQRAYLQGEVLQTKLQYWKNKLEGVTALELPVSKPRPLVQSNDGALLHFSIEEALVNQLQLLSRQQGATLFMTLLSAFKVLLYRYTGRQDICVGTPVAGRQQETEGLIGFFVNTLALRTELSGDDSFTGTLAKVKQTTVDAYEHQEMPFEKVVDAVVKERDLSHSPIFQVMLGLQNAASELNPQLGELQISGVSVATVHTTSKFDLSFNLTEMAEGLNLSVEYATGLFDTQIIGRMVAHFKELLSSIVHEPGRNIDSLSLLAPAEKDQLLTGFNNTAENYQADKTVIDLLEEQVAKTPDAIAVIFEDTQLTYRQLNERSNQLAHYLRKQGVAQEMLIPICLERSLEMIIGILAILKAGAAYVPIDPAYPQERISYMLNDTSAGIILTTNNSKTAIPADETYTVIAIDEWEQIGNEPIENMAVKPLPHQLAYCIYTSGSTGQPKGALNEHKGIMNRLSWGQDYFKLTAQDAVLQKTTFAFDVSVWELLWPLLAGARLVFVKPGGHRDTGYLQSVINSQHITVIHFVPSMLEAFLSDIHPGDCPGLKKVFCSGEALKASHVQLFHEKLTTVELHNLYGPTETAIEVTWCNLSKKEENITVVPIGKPVANTPIYLLDKLQNPIPVGVPGDLYIAGIQVGRGYLNRPELTAEKFVTDPFSKVSGASMYKTGDIGRWLEDGNIEYLGRTDDQIKIRGYRIELGEIESLARRSGLVKQVVVFAPADRNGTKRLTGYVVTGEQFTKEALMEYLSLQLPEYMVPQLWIEIDAIPLTPNGKVDKNALPQIDDTVASTIEYTAPRNELEQQLADVWQQLLGINQVGIEDNFFALGGDSILTIQVMSRMRRQGFDLQPKDLFLHQTIEKLAAAIASRSTAKNTMAEQGVLTGTSGLLPIQQWFLHKNVVQVSHFNQAVLLGIDKTVTVTTLQSVIEQLILRHDALRFTYTQTAEGWQQHYGDSSTTIVTEDLRDSTEPDMLAAQIQQKANHHQQQLDIESGQLLRAVFIQTPGTESHNRLLLIIHHLATDGISWRILLEDMEQLLDAAGQDREMNLGYKTSSYRQWYHALQQYGQSKRLLSQKKHWQQTIQQYEPLLVDTNYEAPVTAADIHHYSLGLSAEGTKQLLQEAPQAYHTEINDLLLAALTMTLTEWSGNNKVVIGLEGHGREAIAENIDLSRTVGWFTTLYPVLLQVENEGEAGIIKSIKEQLRKVPDRGIGYGVLRYINQEKLLQTDSNSWDIIFNYLGQLDNVVKQSRWLAGATESAGNGMGEKNEVSEKLSINSSVRGGKLVVNWSYSSKHYRAETIEALAANYLDNLQALINHCLRQQSEGPQKTPSDYGLGQEITYTELDAFLEDIHNGVPRRAQLQSLYRLSGLQQGMLFHSLYDEKGGGAYTEQLTCDLLNVNLEHLQKSWQQVMVTHSILRSGFYYDVFSIPVQAVYKNVTLPVEELDYRSLSSEQQAAAVQQYENEEKSKGFDFTTVPLMRIGLLRLSAERYHMVWTFHHILSDGWSLPVVMEEFLSTYESLATDNTVIKQEEDKFEEYIRFIESGNKEAEENYWRQYLQGVEQATLLPFISNSKERNKGAGIYGSLPLHFTEVQTAQVKAFAQRQHLTVNTLVQGVWSLLLHHYTGSKNIVYGVTVSGRPDELPGIEKKVGMYINTLPLHSSMDDGKKVTEWLATLQNHQVASRQYQHTPLPEIQNWMGVPGDLFDSILVFENFPLSELTSSKKWLLQIENAHVQEQTNYPLTIIVSSTGSLTVRFSYNTSLLETVYVEKIATHFEHVLLQLIAANDLRLPDVKVITPSEKKQVLQDFNNTSTEYPADKTIVDLFEEQVAKTPDAIAVVFEGVQLTYAQLNNRSNQLAYHLLGLGVQSGTLVPICMERSAEMMIAILGILKAGCAYVPINVDYPSERISFMLEDSAATLIVCSRKSEVALPGSTTISKVYIDDSHSFSQPEQNAELVTTISPQDLAYVMYTSASTGKAKGVLVEHGNVISLVKGVHYTTFSGSDTLLATGSFAFDASTFEYWGMLLNGGRLVLCREEVLLDTRLLKQEIASNGVNKIWFTASWLNQLVDTDISVFEGLKTVLAGGEKLSEKHISALKKAYPAIVIINGYGPTENTTFSLTHAVTEADAGGNIPIGQPLNNRTAFITDSRGQLMPVGVPGEIWLGGAGVARGYLNRNDLTVEKFISNPFSKAPGARIYKTGDIGRWLPDGNIEFLGRIDDQVKIRGYRIELGEIENALQQYTGVLQAVVVAPKDRNGNKSLAAYVVTESNFSREAITAYLKEGLPAYMIPQWWVQMESFPLTPNGKIDKKALPAPDTGGETGKEYVAPTTETETQLVEIWLELLGVKQPGIHDNFFEMGGHSLLVVRMVPLLKKRFGLLVPIPVIFKFPTIYELGNYLEWQQEPEEEDSNTTFEVIKI